ncbi:exodeoxyribonuclease III [Synechococcus elongatus]|uniref:Exodeoxyribonuclease III n=1 Tax=Synechococcus elongatus PCC 11801 TaxID=2219813 RepID=A0AAN1QM66_SYNEL|nr:exodeoxyribonuclease III [Synechococcus elongatus]AZB71846.1 exodeoxyribonuclease III [Synechococcus elongatus PCC 11801]
MRIATWNVNSIRSRLEHLQRWLTDQPVDVVCLQETKVVDEQFPLVPLQELGYHCAISGQKSYNGVSILSRQPLEDVQIGFGAVLAAETVGDLDDQKRVISGRIGSLRIINLYVPNGSEIGSEKYEYKLRWLDCLQRYLRALGDRESQIHICGDFNIALEDRDIYDPKGKETHIMSSPTEREVLRQSVLSLGFVDAFRLFEDGADQFSWWDYRTGGFRRNRGWRIDHHYLSESAKARAIACYIDREPRGWEKPSDHTPVVLELADES